MPFYQGCWPTLIKLFYFYPEYKTLQNGSKTYFWKASAYAW